MITLPSGNQIIRETSDDDPTLYGRNTKVAWMSQAVTDADREWLFANGYSAVYSCRFPALRLPGQELPDESAGLLLLGLLDLVPGWLQIIVLFVLLSIGGLWLLSWIPYIP